MTTYPHELTECEDCGVHYCMGCAGEECPNCKLVGVAFYGMKLENKLEAVKKQLFVVPSIHVQDYQRMMRKILKILEAEVVE